MAESPFPEYLSAKLDVRIRLADGRIMQGELVMDSLVFHPDEEQAKKLVEDLIETTKRNWTLEVRNG